MRTMQSLVGVFVLSGVLLFPTQTVQACHGKRCSLCAAKGCSGNYGYANSGYGFGSGYAPSCGYANPNTYGYGYGYPSWYCPPSRTGRDGDAVTTTQTTSKVDEKLKELEDRIAAYETYANTRLDNLQTNLNRFENATSTRLDKMTTDTTARLDRIQKALDALASRPQGTTTTTQPGTQR